ncbi:MAG: hypothetical protein Q4E22_00025 [Coriobacteriia bacterium]|nr:hypothetical protein [Coriobacteriia bacterium]
MKFTDYINKHHVFTTSSLSEALDSKAAAEEQLRLAVKSGAVERVRRGLLVSNRGRYEGVLVDQTELVSALDANAVISYHSALEAYGVAHNLGYVCYFRSDLVHTKFEFRGVSYLPCGPVAGVSSKALRSASGLYLATTKEQTFVDCLEKPNLAGGIEEAVRSLTTFAYLDVNALMSHAVSLGPTMVSRVAWLLSEKKNEWHVSDQDLSFLESQLGPGPYRLLSSGKVSDGWSPRWKLIFPDKNEEVESWITRF